ncbi:MAG: ABC transporter ATP-binding protein [Bacteroidota bacterium]
MSDLCHPMTTLVKRTLALTLPFLWKSRGNLAASIATLVIVLIGTLVSAVTPPLLGHLLKGYREHSVSVVSGTLGLLLLCWCARFTLYSLRSIIFFRVINQAIQGIRLRVVMQLHQVPVQDWERYGVTEIISASTRVSSSIRRCMSIALITVFPGVLKFMVCSAALVYAYPHTWYFPLLATLAYVLVYVDVVRLLRLRIQFWDNTDSVNTAMDDSLHSTKSARYHLETETKRLQKLFDKEARGWLHDNFLQYRVAFLQGLFFSISISILVIQLISRMRAGQLTVTDFVVVKGYAFAIHHQIHRVSAHFRRLLNSVVDLKKILDLLALPTATETTDTTAVRRLIHQKEHNPTGPVLQMRDVAFTYAGGQKVLQGLSLDIYTGDQIAIIGPSGQGKSTLCHLIAGVYQPHQGEVLLYGVPLKSLSPATIRQHIYFVDQDANLVNGSILENIAADTTDIQTASLGYLKDRLHATTGDVGKKLSSGERQRVLIARCLSYRPEVLILDETLNALDEKSAQGLLKLILDTVPTVILVTHQPSLAQQLQRVYQLEQEGLKLVDSMLH